MINLEDAYSEKIEFQLLAGDEKSRKTVYHYRLFKDIQCECGKIYPKEQLDLAVFLHGVFFLVGKNYGYVGFTCPSCIKTILMKGPIDLMLLTRQSLLQVYSHHLCDNPTILNYNSSVIYSVDHVPGIKQYDILWAKRGLSGRSREQVESLESSLYSKSHDSPGISEDYLCSYLLGVDLASSPPQHGPRGEFFLVMFCKEAEVAALVKLEEETGLKIFPRYYFGNSVIDKIETFAWDNYLRAEYLQHEKEQSTSNIQKIRDELAARGIDWQSHPPLIDDPDPDNWDEVRWDAACAATTQFINGQSAAAIQPAREELPADGFDWQTRFLLSEAYSNTPKMLQIHIDQLKEKQPNDTRLASDFFESLTADLNSKDCAMPVAKDADLLCRVENPFEGKEIRCDLQVDLARIKSQVQKFQGDAKVLKIDASKVYVQQFLADHVDPFITEYIEAAKRKDFSYAKAWQLQRRYLNRLYDDYEKNQLSDMRYSFFEEGGAWTIVFDGYVIPKLEGKGFRYLQYMVIRPHEYVTHLDLEISDKGVPEFEEPDLLDKEHGNVPDSDDTDYSEGQESGSEGRDYSQQTSNNPGFGIILDSSTSIDILKLSKDIKTLEGLITLLSKRGPSALLTKKKGNLKLMKQSYVENRAIQKGKLKFKMDKSQKNIQDRVAKNIETAIDSLGTLAKEKDKKMILVAWKHFQKSFVNLRSSRIAYTPADTDIDIRWHCNKPKYH